MAGPLATARFLNPGWANKEGDGINLALFGGSGDSDVIHHIIGILHRYAGGAFNPEIYWAAIQEEVWHDVLASWPAVEAVAKVLLERGILTGVETDDLYRNALGLE